MYCLWTFPGMLQGLTHYGDMITVLGWGDLGEKAAPNLGSSIYRVIAVLGRSAMGSDKHSSHPNFWFIHLICSILPISQTSTMLQLATKIFHPRRLMQKNSWIPFSLTPAGPNAQDWRIIWIWAFQGFSWDALAVTALVSSAEGCYYTAEYMISTPKFWLQ